MYTDVTKLKCNSPIMDLGAINGNHLFMKRDDLIPYSFGGNKVRKAILFFQEIDSGNYDCAVTYGSSHSNHCRIIANMAAARGMPCYIISPEEVSDQTFNSAFMDLFGAEICTVPVDLVHDTIEQKLESIKSAGKQPYFIPGGGHGNIGTEAYVRCYDEIRFFESESNIHFDYVFFASGTGTTQAGLVCGQLIRHDERTIVGISIARKNPYGRQVVIDSIHDYLSSNHITVSEQIIESATVFIDRYINGGYSQNNSMIQQIIIQVMKEYGIPLDSTYTGKAFFGMLSYIKEQNIDHSNLLFIHTGGTPLFFDNINEMKREQ